MNIRPVNKRKKIRVEIKLLDKVSLSAFEIVPIFWCSRLLIMVGTHCCMC